MSVLGLSRRESRWKDAEILMLRHQLAVAHREWPRLIGVLTWPDRAWLALQAGTLPVDRLAAMRLIVSEPLFHERSFLVVRLSRRVRGFPRALMVSFRPQG